ncbi:MAG TPA: AAA family ATPase [Bacteroidales bacterium]|nr:AAA family ATPase [Bacteroidales bacterium]HRX96750.1 AAA family ATPase [Bacteroidales bacterium]
MKIEKVHIKSRFKNLEDFQFDFGKDSTETVLLGLNATGKSNFMEALVIIFRDLDLERNPVTQKKKQRFEYNISYECRGLKIEIDYTVKKRYRFLIDGKPVSKKHFNENKNKYLPSHVFVYYSGLSERLKDLYAEHKVKQFERMMKFNRYEDFSEMPRIFLVEPIHASLALIAFFLFPEREDETLKFLKRELNIVDFGSALFMLKQANWSKSRKGEDDFWHADGLVRRFMEDLWRFSVAPMFFDETVKGTLKKRETLNRLYLFIKDKETFASLVDIQMFKSKIPLFNALCSLHFSEFMDDEDVRIKVIKENVEGELAMGELSEGEKQLITVLGLLKFTKDDEALILLDEPDTHLNPIWKWKYLDFLNEVVHNSDKTQVVFCTHDPLVIGSMGKEQVRVFKRDENYKSEVIEPDVNPKEMSVAKILTSELFGIPSIMSKEVEDKLNQKRYLQSKIIKGTINEDEKEKFEELKMYLDSIGFYDISIDSRYNKFLELTSDRIEFTNRKFTPKEEEELDKISREVMDEILKNEKKNSE